MTEVKQYEDQYDRAQKLLEDDIDFILTKGKLKQLLI